MTPEDERYLALEQRVKNLEVLVMHLQAQRLTAPAPPTGPVPPPETFDWGEASRQLAGKKKVARASWDDGRYLTHGNHAPYVTLVVGDQSMRHVVAREDLNATDWRIVE